MSKVGAEEKMRDAFTIALRNGKAKNYNNIFRMLDSNDGGRVSKIELVTGMDKAFKVELSLAEAEELIKRIKGVPGFSLDEFMDFFEAKADGRYE